VFVRAQTATRVVFAVIGVLVAVLALFVVAVGVTAAVQPGCEGCHATGAFGAATKAGPHAEVECTACHGGGSSVTSRVSFATAQVTGMYLPLRELDPSVASVDSARCRECHAEQLEQVAESSGLKILHSSCASTRECTECHSPTAHGEEVSWPRSATMVMCFECHGSGNLSAECDLCHAAKLPDERVKTDVFRVTHGPNYLKTHGMGDMNSCVACHESSKCAKCHGAGLPHPADFVSNHADSALSKSAKCTDCHAKQFCNDCHGYPMPHPEKFTKGHGELVDRVGDEACKKCHDPADCTQCHEDHVHPTTLDQLRSLGIDVSGGDGQ